ncbi:hypothetical protein OROGR_010444 [Orobanche gracilis]
MSDDIGKSPAARAMDWSIQLEKCLRSKTPGKSIEALEEIGRRLEWWNSESELSSAEYRMFGLIPGEDKLFLNAIFLRLADAFRLGNKQIKSGVVKLFMRMGRRRKRDRGGILSEGKLENYLELLRRVKEVFDKGDAEERALALLLFGCWAYFAKDCADIRYTVLSSLVTGNVREVKAALFAAGCLSELSDDFANVFLEILKTMVSSREISSDVKLAGVRAFSKIWRPISLADKAYKSLKLLMDSSDDHFSALMLISLSRIASRWMLLIPTQIKLLTSLQSEETSLHMQATSLRCYHIIFARGVCNFPSTTGTVDKLFGILHKSDFEPTLHLEALRVLHKILLFNLSIIPCTEISELFLKLLAVVKNLLQSSIMSTRVVAVGVLADVSGKFLGRLDMVSSGTGRTLASNLVSFVIDRIFYLATPKTAVHQIDFDGELEVKSLLGTLFNLVERHSYLHCLVLNNICLFIDKLMKMLDSNNVMVEFDTPSEIESKLMIYVSKLIAACLQNLEETDAETCQVLDAIKPQLQNVCCCIYFDSYTSMTYFLLLHLLSTCIYMRHASDKLLSPSRNSSLSYVNPILQSDKLTSDCAKKNLGQKNYWYLYKAGKMAACQGAWSTSAFIFEELITVVQSATCSCWLKSLAQFSTAEKQIQHLLTEQGSSPDYCNYMESLHRASSRLFSAREILEASDMGNEFSFQRWFLTLRANTLKTFIDMIKLLDTLRPSTNFQTLGPLIYSCIEVSCRLNKLARELDLLLTSFLGMDKQSVVGISALALSCSLVAFAAGFAFLVPNMLSSENNKISELRDSKEPFHALLIEDLFGRLSQIDFKTRKNLFFLLKTFHNYEGCFSGRFQNQMAYNASYETVVLHKLTEYSVGEIFGLQNEMQTDGEAVSRILSNGLRLLLDIIFKLMLIPFHIPHHFFRVRPAVSSEIIVMNEDGQMMDGSSILSGFHLSLNLSFQLKNMPVGPPGPIKKAYCILSCKARSQEKTKIGVCEGQAQSSSPDHEIDDLLDLNEKLLRYIAGSVQTYGGPNDNLTVNDYVRFELNDRGRGFATCLLDVSSFPMGSYRIKWHSGCIDSGGSYHSLLPATSGPLFSIRDMATV